jgi:hypothetical protein
MKTMIAAISLSGLIGTWICTTGGEAPGMKAQYTFRANRTGSLMWRTSLPHTRNFTFVLEDGGLVERFTDGGVTEWHNVTLGRNHLVDETHVYLDKTAGWIPSPLATVLNCRR